MFAEFPDSFKSVAVVWIKLLSFLGTRLTFIANEFNHGDLHSCNDNNDNYDIDDNNPALR